MQKQFLTTLKTLVQEDPRQKRKIDSLLWVLAKIKSKQQNLQTLLHNETNQKKQKELKRHILIAQTQQKKGERLLSDMEKPSQNRHNYKPTRVLIFE